MGFCVFKEGDNMKQPTDLIDKRFGKLVVKSYYDTANNKHRWLCLCDCGNTCVATTSYLKSGRKTNCGCLKSPDLTGKTYGKLTVIGRSDKRNFRGKRTTPMWECRCECGTVTYKATDTLTNPDISMCSECASKYAAEKARAGAGFIDGTQISKIKNMKPPVTNTSGVHGVYLDKKTNQWRARLRFKGKNMSFGSYINFEDAVMARKKAEQEYFGTFLDKINLC